MNCLALVTSVSFAIQQLLQLLDPFVSRLPGLEVTGTDPVAANKKKAFMGLLAVFLGGLVVWGFQGDLLVLKCAGITNHDALDKFVSAFILGAGTEASNTAQKILSYAKDKLKPA